MLCPVQENLLAALLRIRRTDEPVVLWVDALCINQASAGEKTQQVNMMSRIYTTCTQCLIWLGEIDDDVGGDTGEGALEAVSAAFDVLRLFARRPTLSGNEKDNDKDNDSDDDDDDSKLPPSIATRKGRDAAREALRAMAHSPWWARIWTVQEACLPPRATLLWGPLRLSLKTLTLALDSLLGNWTPSKFVRGRPGIDFYDIFPYAAAESRFMSAPVNFRIAREWAIGSECLLHRLWRFRNRQATDPRDKVYALVSLLGPGALPSVPSCDYSLDAATVFRRVMLDMLRSDGSLRPLIGWREEKRSTPGLPTWALDLVEPTDSPMGAAFWLHTNVWWEFAAASGLADFDGGDLGTDETLLRLNGVFVDRVAARSEFTFEEEDEDGFESRILLLDVFTTQDVDEAGGLGTNLSIPVVQVGIQEALNDIIEGKILPHADDQSRREWKSSMIVGQRHVPFVTRSRRVGIAPQTLKVGDEVWILSGGNTPFILRPCDKDADPGQSNYYTYVGDAYVHGIMLGEAATSHGSMQRSILLR